MQTKLWISSCFEIGSFVWPTQLMKATTIDGVSLSSLIPSGVTWGVSEGSILLHFWGDHTNQLRISCSLRHVRLGGEPTFLPIVFPSSSFYLCIGVPAYFGYQVFELVVLTFLFVVICILFSALQYTVGQDWRLLQFIIHYLIGDLPLLNSFNYIYFEFVIVVLTVFGHVSDHGEF